MLTELPAPELPGCYASCAAIKRATVRMISPFPSTLQLLTTLTTPAIAQTLVSRYGSLTEIAKAPEEELKTITGVGSKKARQIQSALDLARVLSREAALEQPLMDTPERVADLLREEARVSTVETVHVLLLNTRRKLIKIVPVSQGGLDSVMLDTRSVFRMAIAANAAAMILVHNHPGSGDPSPSDADIRVTRDLIRAGQFLKIEVLDHVILGQATAERPKDYYSLREGGYFY